MGRVRKQKHGPPEPSATAGRDVHPACDPRMTKQAAGSWKHYQNLSPAQKRAMRRH